MKRMTAFFAAVVMLMCISHAFGVAVMSVDFGSEWMKVGIVSPGVPMEIALNKESKRKTPSVISFRDNVRSYGEDAQTVGIRFPKNSYQYLLDLLGKDINHPIVKLYQKRFPYYNIVENKDRGTIQFQHDEDVFYSPEELIAQLLYKAKFYAEQGADQPIQECVIVVPGFFNQIERKAMINAAQLAGLKVLQLVNDHMAVALNYGIFKSKDFNETAQYVMFYDMGASSTKATIISMQSVKTKERGYVETHPQISVVGVGFDRTLGGLEMQIRLRDYLAKKFNEMMKTTSDVFENARAMAKLFKEAGRVKNVLSANVEHYAQIEGLLDEKDFRLLVTRDEFETLCADVLKRVPYPVKQALETAGLSADVISQVVLVGGGTRAPKVQELLRQAVKQDIAKNLNADEAATMGAVYRAAELSISFKVKKFIIKDAVLFPLQVIFERESDGVTKLIKRTLFNLMNPYPQKKKITFNKRTEDFSFNVNYADLDYLMPNEILNVGPMNLSEIHVQGVSDAIAKHASSINVETKGITAHFALDESGILHLANIEYVVDKTETPGDDEEGTFSKLGSTISKLFGGDGDEKAAEGESDDSKSDAKTSEANEDPSKEESKHNSSAKQNASNEKTFEQRTNDEAKDKKPKIVTYREPIESFVKHMSVEEMSKDDFKLSETKIEALNKIEKELVRRETALNNLESFVIDVQNRLEEDDYKDCVDEEEKNIILLSCSQVSDWLYDDGSDADAKTYEIKLSDLKTLTRDFYSRAFEHRERPEALSALKTMLNSTANFLEFAKNNTKAVNPDQDVFTDIEIEVLAKLIASTMEWRDKMVLEQEALKKSDPVVLTVKMLSEKMQSLEREVKYLFNKFKLWKPKIVEKPVVEEAENTTSESATEEPKTVIEDPNETESTGDPKEAESASERDSQQEELLEPTHSNKPSDPEHSEL